MEITPLDDPYALLQDGSRPLTDNWDAGEYAITTTGAGTFGYVNITDETEGYQIDGTQVLSLYNTNLFLWTGGNFTLTGTANLLAGVSSGSSLTTGSYNTIYGYAAGQGITAGQKNTLVGSSAGGSLSSSESSNVFVGWNAGFNQNGTSNLLIIDNQDRGSAANEAIESMLYGSFNATVSSQYLYANVGTFRIGSSDTSDPILRFIGSTNTGDITYDESADEFDFGASRLTTTNYVRSDGGLAIGGTPSASSSLIPLSVTMDGIATTGISLTAINTYNTTPIVTVAKGINFVSYWKPDDVSLNKTCSLLSGGFGLAGLDTTSITSGNNMTVTKGTCFESNLSVTSGASHTGNAVMTTGYHFYANNGAVTDGGGGGTVGITTLYGFYDAGQTIGSTNWGLGINTQSYINANLRIGSVVAPTVPLDVTGNAKISGTLIVGTAQTYTPSNVTTDRSYDADTVAIAELADVVGTLIADLQTIGLIV